MSLTWNGDGVAVQSAAYAQVWSGALRVLNLSLSFVFVIKNHRMLGVLILKIVLFVIPIFVSAMRDYMYKVRLFSVHLYNKSRITQPNSFSHPMQNDTIERGGKRRMRRVCALRGLVSALASHSLKVRMSMKNETKPNKSSPTAIQRIHDENMTKRTTDVTIFL